MLQESLKRGLIRIANSAASLDMIWVDKGIWISPETLESLNRKFACRLIHYTPDSQFIINRSRHFLGSVGIYDHLITTKCFEVSLYEEAGARDLILASQSYCPTRFAHPKAEPRFNMAIGLISDYKPPYARVIRSWLRRYRRSVCGVRCGCAQPYLAVCHVSA